jgi:hypothetical protein
MSSPKRPEQTDLRYTKPSIQRVERYNRATGRSLQPEPRLRNGGDIPARPQMPNVVQRATLILRLIH